jgi:zinc protease
LKSPQSDRIGRFRRSVRRLDWDPVPIPFTPVKRLPTLDSTDVARTAPGTVAVSAAGGEKIVSTRLSNGMRIIVWPDRNIPNVALYNWVRVGSRNETAGLTGLAHFFEHMMFNGTARHAPGEFDRVMESHGGSSNAFTTDDVTVYQDWFPSRALEPVLELEADRIANLTFAPETIERERAVVLSERRLRVEDSNAGFLAERMQATAFSVHPYRFPTIGWPADIRAWRRTDLEAFFRTNYAPNNQTLVLVGDVAPEQVLALARKLLEPIPRQEPPAPVCVREPEQAAERRLTIRRKGQSPLVQYAFKAPAACDPRAPAVNLLMAALVEGAASRLHNRLVEERKLAVEIGGDWHEGFDPSLLWLYATLPQGGDSRAFRRALDAELACVADEGISASELRRAQNLIAASFWKQRATIDGKAHLLGEYELFHGDWRRMFEAPARFQAVASAEVRAVARAILDPKRRTVGVLRPRAPASG